MPERRRRPGWGSPLCPPCCDDELANGSLVALLPDWQQPKVPIYLLFPERRLMPRKLRVFIDFLVANGPAYGIDNLL